MAGFAQEPSGAILPQTLPAMPYLQDDISSADTIELIENRPPVTVEMFEAEEALQSAGTYDFFEDFHVIPRAFDFGNLLSDQSTPIEVFSAFRHATYPWQTFVNNAGTGVSLGSDPPLPIDVPPLTGFQMTLDVSANGPPYVDSTLDFGFDIGTIYVSITIQRIVLWGLEPEMPYSEILGFLTDVMAARSGIEQRFSLRKNPRQTFEYSYLIEEGETRQVLENLLFDWQARIFGVPVWWEDTALTIAATAGDISIAVGATAYRDFRVGGLVAIFTSQTEFDVLTVDTIGATSLDFTSPLVNSYDAGTLVFPLRPCHAESIVSGSRYPVGLARMSIAFRSTANDADLADVSAFATYNGKVLLDRFNSVLSQTSPEDFEQELIDIDNETGVPLRESPWDLHKRGHLLVVRASGRQEVWELRGLAHALRGRQVSFYVPRHRDDLVVTSDLLNASNLMQVANYGYAQFVRARQPKNVIRLSFNDGSPALVRTITGSSNVSASTDQLQVDTNWPATIDYTTIERVEYCEKVRLDTDDVELQFDNSGHRARLVAPVKAVFD